jgi:hypothetical protein
MNCTTQYRLSLSPNEKAKSQIHHIKLTNTYLSRNGKIEAAGPREIGVKLLMALRAGKASISNACPNSWILDL